MGINESLCVRDCDPLPLGRGFATYAVDVSALALVGGGVEGAITRRLIGFGTVRAVAGKESGVSAFAGIRVRGKQYVVLAVAWSDMPAELVALALP